jgi:hypothetical protein
MINKLLNYILAATLLMVCATVTVQAQDIQATARLDKNTIRIGDQTVIRISVVQPIKEHVVFPKLADTITSKIQLVSTGKLDTVVDQKYKDHITVTLGLTVTAFDAGSYVVPAFNIATKAGVIKTNELVLEVKTVAVDTTKSIYDIKQPLAVSYNWLDWLRDNWPLVVVPLIVVLLVLGIIWYIRSRPKTEKVVEEVKPIIPIHTLALNQLTELRNKKLWQSGYVKQYHSELTDVLRDYLEKRYAVKTHEKTTDEIFAGLKYMDIVDENRNKLRQILKLADLVKFAKENPQPADNELSMDNAMNFIIQTKQVAEPTVKTGGTDDLA